MHEHAPICSEMPILVPKLSPQFFCITVPSGPRCLSWVAESKF